ncbi:MAG TPA: AMP-binding protein [Noviherbaspirillum sp.]|nr:AMP-binding protein [Noviherbaspirillum sp.]
MHKPWLQSYPSKVPAEIDLEEFSSLKALLEQACLRYGDLPAFTNLGASITYRQLEQLSRAFAAYLQKTVGLARGDRVAIMMPNLLQYPVALFGALRAGCVVVNTNPLYTARELQHQLEDSGAVAIVVLDHFAHTVQEVLPCSSVRHVITTRLGDLLHFPKAQLANFVVKHVKHMVPEWHIDGAISFHDVLKRGADMVFEDVLLQREDTAFLQYTGGTTGVPKGAILTHGNLVANLQQTEAWVKGVLTPKEETSIIPLPLYHVFALTATLAFFKLGANNVLITNPRDIPAFIKELKHTRFSALIGVNTLFNALLNAPGIEEVDATHVKVVVAGGMAVQRSVAKRWHEVFGVPIVEGYGLTETSPIACANPLDINEYTGMIGLPLPSTEAAILDDDGNELSTGALGEICIRGPQVMKGYWNKPDETAHVFARGGWLRTGDMGCMDERGYIKLVDRKKDVIVVSGFKVFPNEVEDVVVMHPGVLEAAAIGAADEHSDQAVKIVVVRKDPALTADALLEHCKQNLTAYKVPKYIVFREQPLPKSNIGKILRRVVKEEEEHPAPVTQPENSAAPAA